MRRQISALVGLIGVLMLGGTTVGQAQDAFKDGVGSLNQPMDHWAYVAVEDLAQKGILKGYPDGYFRGNRALTRYEFAVTMKRFIDYFAKQNEPRKVSFLKELEEEIVRVQEEAANYADAYAPFFLTKMTTVSVVEKPHAEAQRRKER